MDSQTQIEPISWTMHLAARRPWRAVLALLFIVFGLFALHAMGANGVVLLMAAVILLTAIAEFLFPVNYRLDTRCAQIRILGSRREFCWGRVRRVYLRKYGIQLSPFSRANWLESYRGIFLRAENPRELLVQVCAYLRQTGVTAEIIEDLDVTKDT